MSENEVAVLAQKIDGLQELVEAKFSGLNDRLDLVTSGLRRDLDDTNQIIERRFQEHLQEHNRLSAEDKRIYEHMMSAYSKVEAITSRLETRIENIEKVVPEHKELMAADKRMLDTINVNSGRIDILEKMSGKKAQSTLSWIAATAGAIVIAGLLTLAGYGVVHAIEQGLASGQSVSTQQGPKTPTLPTIPHP